MSHAPFYPAFIFDTKHDGVTDDDLAKLSDLVMATEQRNGDINAPVSKQTTLYLIREIRRLKGTLDDITAIAKRSRR